MSFNPDTGKSKPREEKKAPEGPSAKDLFTGRTLDGAIERGKVKGLDEFESEKSALRLRLENQFKLFNPTVGADMINFAKFERPKRPNMTQAELFQEVCEDLQDAYPQYNFGCEKEVRFGKVVEENPLVQQFRDNVTIAREAGISDQQIADAIRKTGLNLQRPTSAGLKDAMKRIDDLTAEIEELKKTEKEPAPSPQDIELLYGEFRLAIKNRTGKEPSNPEYDKFTACVEVAPTLGEAKRECTRLIEILTPKAAQMPTTALAGAISLPSWTQYLENRLSQDAEQRKREEARGPQQQSSHLIAVLNRKTDKIQNIKFYSKEQAESYLRQLPNFYEYTVLKGDITLAKTGFGLSKQKR